MLPSARGRSAKTAAGVRQRQLRLDAYVRHYALRVPPDCVAAIHHDLGEAALRMMERNMSARLALSAECLDR
ncbi:hypothetical protein [Nonomuraea sp. NPDC049158]|uniref:hypothetical protein n=1 Tax=Nonomuraea sp. NPDC049158 TaxID=3155649 RepID=UPI0033F6B792